MCLSRLLYNYSLRRDFVQPSAETQEGYCSTIELLSQIYPLKKLKPALDSVLLFFYKNQTPGTCFYKKWAE